MDKSSLLVDALAGHLPTEVDPDFDLVWKLDESDAPSRLLETEHGTGAYGNGSRWRAFTFPLDVEGDVLPSQQLAFLASVRLRQLGTLAAEPALPDAGGDADGEGGDDEAGGGAELVGDELAVMYVLHSKSVSQTVLDQIWVQLRNDVVGEVLGTIVR